jgi:hypothetical protein
MRFYKTETGCLRNFKHPVGIAFFAVKAINALIYRLPV